MKIKYYFLTILIAVTGCITSSAQVGIGTTAPNARAILDITSTDKGVLLPRLSQAQVNTLITTLNSTQEGLLIYNTTQQCYQIWNGALLQFTCLAKVSTGNEGIVVVDVVGAPAAAAARTFTHPACMRWTSGDQELWKQFNPAAADIAINASKTDWPENQTNPGLTAIYTDNFSTTTPTAFGPLDLWKENQDVPGNTVSQTHIWQISVLGNPGGSSGGQFEARLRNPVNNDVVGYSQVIPAVAGLYTQTFTFITSRPLAPAFYGYVLEFRAQKSALDIWIGSITRTSLFKD